MDELFFVVSGPVVAWQRARSDGAKRFTSKEQRQYQAKVRAIALGHRPQAWRMDGRYTVWIHYTPHDRRRRDIDNVAKTLMDSLNGVAWDDDSQVDELRVKRHDHDRDAACVHVMARLVNPA